MENNLKTARGIAELLSIAEAPHWPQYTVHIAPAIMEYIAQTAQDVNVDISTVINIWLAAQIVRISNDET